MPQGLNDTVVDTILDKVAGASADNTILGATMYLTLLTTAPSNDNGTGAVEWSQGRTAVATVSGTNWPAASARSKTGAAVTMNTNASGATITAVAFAWYSASTAGTYLGGGPLPGSSLAVPNGSTPVITPTLSSPSP